MAEKRMFAKSVVFSDDFLDMSPTARLLYYSISMTADDDGFVNNPKSLLRLLGTKQDAVDELVESGFLIRIRPGLLLVTHWRVNNNVREDRKKESPFNSELEGKIVLRDDVYTMLATAGQLPGNCQPACGQLPAQYSIDENSIDIGLGIGKVKDSIDIGLEENRVEENSIEENRGDKHTRHRYGEYSKVLLTDEEFDKLKEEFPADWSNWINRLDSYIASKGDKYKNHLATIRNWARQDKEKEQKGKINWDEV